MFEYKKDDVVARIKQITENRAEIIPDTMYKRDNGLHWYKSKKGYYHIVKSRKVSCGGNFIHYEMVDKMLTINNYLLEVQTFGSFQTKEEITNYIENEFEFKN